MSRITENGRTAIRLVGCVLATCAIGLPVAPAYAFSADGASASAPYQHDIGTSEVSTAAEPAPYQHDLGTAEISVDPTAGGRHASEPSGFDWSTAGIVVGAMLGLLVLAAAAGMMARGSRRRVARH